MTPEEYHKALEAFVAQYPVQMQQLVPFPDGEDDIHRGLIILTLERILNGTIITG